MSALSVQVPYPVFYDRSGLPLDNGSIYIGTANLDPITNPIPVYYDAALTIPASQPLKTSDGYIYRNGTPAQVYVDAANFSITVKDNKNTLVYSFPDGTGISPNALGIIYNQGDTGAVDRTVTSKLQESVSVQDFGAVGDGVTSDQSAVEDAVASCVASGAFLYWPTGTYLTTANIPDFHSIRHFGPGAVKRSTDLYYPEPDDTQTSILYVGASGSATNDGLSSGQPLTVAKAFAIVKAMGSETLNGTWRLQFLAGSYTDNGLALDELPFFKNKLEVFGANVNTSGSEVPTTIWDGTTSAPVYALRIDSSAYPSALVNLYIKNIKFTNWADGAIVIWAHGNTLIENVHVDTTETGLWLRHGYFKIRYGIYNKCYIYGIGIQYNGTANIGNNVGGGITFTNCAEGVKAGRFVVCYVQGCTFSTNASNIGAEWLARIHTQKNTLGEPTDVPIVIDGVSSTAIGGANFNLNGNCIFTDDNGAGNPTTFYSLSEAKPYATTRAGSVNPYISRYGQRALHSYNGISLEQGNVPVNVFTVATTSKILLADNAYGGSDYIPFRIPAYTLYSPTFELEIILGIRFAANAGGTLDFHGQGSAASTKLCGITIPTAVGVREGWLKLNIKNIPNNTNARYEFQYVPSSIYEVGQTSSLNDTAIRDSNDSDLIFRLYWTSATTDVVTFNMLRSYVLE